MGATLAGCDFRVWAPHAREVTLRLIRRGAAPADLPMQREGEFFFTHAPASRGDRYFYLLDGGPPVPDPVSRFLPEGVHGPTEIVDADAFSWSDQQWRGPELRDYILYELHIGAFTPAGTFAAAIEKLPYLRELGITAIQIMPVAAFPGARNWGYDGVSLYAVQESYGGPEGLKRLVDAAHRQGLAVILDVVYNHLGPEGNYLERFGPYFTDRHHTPWGKAANYDQPGAQGARRLVVENALYWVREYHVDGLRLDAIQTIHDDSPRHIVSEIREQVHALAQSISRSVVVIAESDENDTRIVRSPRQNGYGLDAVWSDDFHHALHALLTGERAGYYQDFGKPEQLVRALTEGFVFQGEYFAFWKAERGTPAGAMPLPAHVICIQNHDQVGNRAMGDRLTALVPRGARKLAAALLLLAPQTPLLFMGQEYDEANPFQFFSSFEDPQLRQAVTKGRREEFKDFDFNQVPDPQDPATFERSKLNWTLVSNHNDMLRWYRELIALRKRLVSGSERRAQAEWSDGVLRVESPPPHPALRVVAAFPGSPPPPSEPGWELVLQSDEDGYSVQVYERAR